MELITTILAFLFAVGVLIVIHELGHYSIARACGVKVLRFSVGFGRPLLRWVRGADRTEWVLCAIPYGGYVKMLDTRDLQGEPLAPADRPRAFDLLPVARRAAIVAAGPSANLLLAVLLYWVVALAGALEPPPILAPPTAGSLAQEAGLDDGDQVLAIDGRATRAWSDLRWAVLRAGLAGSVLSVRLVSIEGVERVVQLDLRAARVANIDDDWFVRIGIERGAGAAVVRALVPGAPAQQAGLLPGDRIVAVDGVAVRTAAQLTARVRAATGQAQRWQLERRGSRFEVTITPAAISLPDGRRVGRVGIDFNQLQPIRYGAAAALVRAGWRTWETASLTLRLVGRMVMGQASWRNLSGPVTTAEVAGRTARIGIVAYLNFLALVSISIGVFNLLPIPVLDGGHLLYYAVEIVKGSPPSEQAVELAQRFGVGMLMLLTALALFNDLTRLLS